jgi:hypothetical protein
MNDVISQASFLRTSRNFPEEPRQLSIEVDRSYIDIARNVNNRTIGFFTLNKSTVNGENWFITQAKRQQGLRQVYRFDDTMLVGAVITIAHEMNFLSLTNIVRIWGTFFDGTFWQTLPYVDVINVTNQINVKVDSTNIIITKGAGAPPAMNNGLVIVEFIAQP